MSNRFARTSLVRKWWNDALFFWQTSDRAAWYVAGGVAMFLGLFTTFMHAMVANDTNRRELTCLAMNVYYEARGEPLEGQHGVAAVTMNRVLDSRYPNTVCEVVHQQKWDYLRKRNVSAFSWTELDSVPEPKGKAWHRAVEVAEAAIDRRGERMLEGAVHYHARHIRPSWSRGKKPVAKIGRHVFYR